MIILSIESSCDETSVSVTRNGKDVLSNVVLSQIETFKEYGGVVPEISAREHVANMNYCFITAIKEANVSIKDINLVAVTKGPGLIGSLLVGINAAVAFAYSHKIPIIGVNHLLGHIYACQIEHTLKFPAIALLVSGGHTELIYIKDHLDFKIIGQTLDDAVGEAYDKVARTLGLSYPGGPIVDKLAHLGSDTYKLPRPNINSTDYNFSFSGLKSAVINLCHNLKQKNLEVNVNDMCASFQNSVIDCLITKVKKALIEYKCDNLIVAGGVAANKGLKERLKEELKGIDIIIPSIKYCTDNAAMIGIAAYYQNKLKPEDNKYYLKGDSTLDL